MAVSGGIDSMILCDLFLKSNFKFAIAHCNFHLRGEESNRDERFVREYAQKNNIKIHVKDFDTYPAWVEQNHYDPDTGRVELFYYFWVLSRHW